LKRKTFLIPILLTLLLCLCSCGPDLQPPDLPNPGRSEPIAALPTEPTADPAYGVPSQGQEETEPGFPTEDSSFAVHYIDVGQGDCALILCDGAAMLIDGGESDQSSKIYAYLKEHGIDMLDYLVATHGHSDHIGGLSGALNYAKVGTALCPVTSYDSKAFNNLVKYLEKQGCGLTVPKAGDSFRLGSALVEIMGPQEDYEEANDTSIVLKVTYGQTSFLFTGDAERTAEADILDAGCDVSATVLKVGHHGSDTSTSYPFLRAVMPEYAVIQVGSGNSYGHPTEDTLSRLRDADVTVYRNDLQGTIVCTSDGKSVSFQVEKGEGTAADQNPASEAGENGNIIFIGNKNSEIFHRPSCSNLPAEKNRVYFISRQEVVQSGYQPCGNCDP